MLLLYINYMKMSIPFTFPDDKQEYSDCVFGKNYRMMIQSHIEYLVSLDYILPEEREVHRVIMNNFMDTIKRIGLPDAGPTNQTQ